MLTVLAFITFFGMLMVSFVRPRHCCRNHGHPLTGNRVSIDRQFKRITGGGQPTVFNSLYLVSVQYDGYSLFQQSGHYEKPLWTHFCGGTLINQRWVLTAAHCFIFSQNSSMYRIVQGVQSLDESEDGIILEVESIRTHPGFNNIKAGFPDDIALVKLKHPIVNGHYTVSSGDSKVGFKRKNVECYAAGWGDTKGVGRREDMGTLREVRVTIISNPECSEMWKDDDRAVITNKQLCGKPSERAVCDGDSGGPLLCKSYNEYNWKLHGIISWGQEGCNDLHRPSVFTKVSKYTHWIQKTIAGTYAVT